MTDSLAAQTRAVRRGRAPRGTPAVQARIMVLRGRMRAARVLAKPVIDRFYSDVPRSAAMVETLACHLVCEAFDLRTADLRRALNLRRDTLCRRRQAWFERLDNDPALDFAVQALVDQLQGAV